MIPILSLTSLCLGATLTGCAASRPERTHQLENLGGVFFVLGLVLIGSALPLFR